MSHMLSNQLLSLDNNCNRAGLFVLYLVEIPRRQFSCHDRGFIRQGFNRFKSYWLDVLANAHHMGQF